VLTSLLLTGCAALWNPQIQEQRELVYQLDREVIALKEINAQLTLNAGGCDAGQGEPDPIYSELHQVFTSTRIEVARQGRTTQVTIPGDELFAPGSTIRIRSEAEMVLDLLSTALKLHPLRPVLIEGHTDDTPISGSMKRKYATNWELAAARAAVLTRELAEEWGVDASRITIAGRGPFDPIADNSTPEGRAANRRVVVHILPEETP